jgi:hypothetical protein
MDRPLSQRRPRDLGALGGAVTGLTSAIAYFVVPLASLALTDDGRVLYSLDVSSHVLDHFFSQSPLYFLGVLVLVPLVTTVAALRLARRAGYAGRETGVAIIVRVVAGPVSMVWLGAAVALLAVAAQAFFVAVYGFVVALGYALVLSAGVAAVVALSAGCGYALVAWFGSPT